MGAGRGGVVTTLDLAAFAEYNAGIIRARRAYATDPNALSRLLALTGEDFCGRCRQSSHARCTGRMGHGGRHPCLCDHDSHRTRGARP